jgi:hypothetical protein
MEHVVGYWTCADRTPTTCSGPNDFLSRLSLGKIDEKPKFKKKITQTPELGELLQICYFFRKLNENQEFSENRLNGMQFRLFFSTLPPFDDDGSSMCRFRCLDLWCVQLFFVAVLSLTKTLSRQKFCHTDFVQPFWCCTTLNGNSDLQIRTWCRALDVCVFSYFVLEKKSKNFVQSFEC